jgi:hypothetical protein
VELSGIVVVSWKEHHKGWGNCGLRIADFHFHQSLRLRLGLGATRRGGK